VSLLARSLAYTILFPSCLSCPARESLKPEAEAAFRHTVKKLGEIVSNSSAVLRLALMPRL